MLIDVTTSTEKRKTFLTLSRLKYAKKPDIIIVHARTNDIINNTRSFENYEKITDTIKSKLPNYKYAISNVIIRQTRYREESYRVQ